MTTPQTLRLEGLPPVRYPAEGQEAHGVPVYRGGHEVARATVRGELTSCVVELEDPVDVDGMRLSAGWDMRGSAPRLLDLVLIDAPGFPSEATGGPHPDLDPRDGSA